MPLLRHIRANSHTCGYDAITFVESMNSLEVTLSVYYSLGFLWSPFSNSGGGRSHFLSQLVKI